MSLSSSQDPLASLFATHTAGACADADWDWSNNLIDFQPSSPPISPHISPVPTNNLSPHSSHDHSPIAPSMDSPSPSLSPVHSEISSPGDNGQHVEPIKHSISEHQNPATRKRRKREINLSPEMYNVGFEWTHYNSPSSTFQIYDSATMQLVTQQFDIVSHKVESNTHFSPAENAWICYRQNQFKIVCFIKCPPTQAPMSISDSGVVKEVHQLCVKLYAIKEMNTLVSDEVRVGMHHVGRTRVKKEKQEINITPFVNGRVEFANVQFEKSNSVKGQQLEYFKLVMAFYAKAGTGYYHIFSKQSPRLVVRSQNPGFYGDNPSTNYVNVLPATVPESPVNFPPTPVQSTNYAISTNNVSTNPPILTTTTPTTTTTNATTNHHNSSSSLSSLPPVSLVSSLSPLSSLPSLAIVKPPGRVSSVTGGVGIVMDNNNSNNNNNNNINYINNNINSDMNTVNINNPLNIINTNNNNMNDMNTINAIHTNNANINNNVNNVNNANNNDQFYNNILSVSPGDIKIDTEFDELARGVRMMEQDLMDTNSYQVPINDYSNSAMNFDGPQLNETAYLLQKHQNRKREGWEQNKEGESVYYGKVGINVENPTEALTVRGNILIHGDMMRPSDRRIKSEIEKVDSVDQLNTIRDIKLYDYNVDVRRERGVLAQELQQIMPRAVTAVGDVVIDDEVISNLLTINERALLYENIGATQQLDKNLEREKTSIVEIGSKVDDLAVSTERHIGTLESITNLFFQEECANGVHLSLNEEYVNFGFSLFRMGPARTLLTLGHFFPWIWGVGALYMFSNIRRRVILGVICFCAFSAFITMITLNYFYPAFNLESSILHMRIAWISTGIILLFANYMRLRRKLKQESKERDSINININNNKAKGERGEMKRIPTAQGFKHV